MFCHSLFVFCFAEQKMKLLRKLLSDCLSRLGLFVFSFAEEEAEASQEVSSWIVVCLVFLTVCFVAVCLSFALQIRKIKALKK